MLTYQVPFSARPLTSNKQTAALPPQAANLSLPPRHSSLQLADVCILFLGSRMHKYFRHDVNDRPYVSHSACRSCQPPMTAQRAAEVPLGTCAAGGGHSSAPPPWLSRWLCAPAQSPGAFCTGHALLQYAYDRIMEGEGRDRTYLKLNPNQDALWKVS